MQPPNAVSRANTNTFNCFKPIDRTIAIGCVAGITIIAVGIILAAVYWPRGNFQILMTSEGKAVLGLVMSGFILATIATAVLVIRQSRNKNRGENLGDLGQHNKLLTSENANDIRFAAPLKKLLFRTGKEKDACRFQVGKLYIASTNASEKTPVVIFNLASEEETSIEVQNKTDVPPCIAFDEYVLVAQRTQKSYTAFVHSLKDHDEATPLFPLFDSVITTFYSEIDAKMSFTKNHEENVVFIGFENGEIKLLNLASQTTYVTLKAIPKGNEEPDKNDEDLTVAAEKIESILGTRRNITIDKRNYEVVLIAGTQSKIYFWDLSSKETTAFTKLEVPGTHIALTDNKTLVSCDKQNQTATLWNLSELQLITQINFGEKVPNLNCFYCNSAYAVTANKNGKIVVWQLPTDSKTEPKNLKSFDANLNVSQSPSRSKQPNVLSVYLTPNMTIFYQYGKEFVRTNFIAAQQ